MKKTYLSPNTTVVVLATKVTILAGSVEGTGIKGSASGSYDVLSRDYDAWDDED